MNPNASQTDVTSHKAGDPGDNTGPVPSPTEQTRTLGEVYGSSPVILGGGGAANGTDATALPGASSLPSASLTTGPTGTTFGPYELLDEVARGGMGVVYKARQKGLGRMVALKMVLGMHGDHDAVVKRFILEAQSAASLDHPNVVPIYDSGEIDGKLFFTMALVEGPNLKAYIDSHGVPPPAEALALFAQIVAGVAHAHRQGIIHRDLKPANVLMDRDGRPRVTDFGLAKQTGSGSELTGTGQVMGTPAYMPPEQARDSKDVGPPADVYSLGAILYYLLTGRPPFVGETIPDLLIKVVTEDPDPPRTINPNVIPELEEICLACLSKSPADRYPDAQALAAALLPIADRHMPRSSLPSLNLSPLPARTAPGSLPSLSATVSATNTPGLPVVVPVVAEAGRKRRTAALLAAAVLLGGAVLALATGVLNPKGDPVAVVPTPVDKKPADIVPPAAGGAVAAKGDFAVNVGFETPHRRDANGVWVLPAGQKIVLRLEAERDCNVAIWTYDVNGEATQLLPNDEEGGKRTQLIGKSVRLIPSPDKAVDNYDIVLEPTKGAGVERCEIVATTGPLPKFPPGQKQGGFAMFKPETEDLTHLRSVIRGMVIKGRTGPEQTVNVADALVSVAEFTYRVE